MVFRNFLNKLLFKYIYRQWNIAIASVSEDLTPTKARWIKHTYKDRWFADPFILYETNKEYIILAEEYIRDDKKARLARLTVNKKDCTLLKNETILNLPTHLSFPNFISINGKTYIYPENGRSGSTDYYEYGEELKRVGVLSPLPLADAVIQKIGDLNFMFFTIGKECNGNKLIVYSSENSFGPYHPFQEIFFIFYIARRAGRFFYWKGKLVSPAQVCNNAYGEALSLQEVIYKDNKFFFKEIKRIYPNSEIFPHGLHTYNTLGEHVVIDGYKYDYPLISKLYFKIRGGGI